MSKLINTLVVCTLGLGLFQVDANAGEVPDTVGILSTAQFVKPANVIGKSAWIPLLHVRQEKNLCVPTSASMVLALYSNPHLPREIKIWTRDKVYDPTIPFNDFTLTYFNDLISGLKNHSIFWSKQIFSNDVQGYGAGISVLLKQLDSGHPVLVDTSLNGGHTFVVAGYEDQGNSILAMDPNIPDPGIRKIPTTAFQEIWNSAGVGSNRRAAVVTRP